MNVLFLGDSITDCGHCFTPDNLGNGYVKKLSLLPGLAATNGGTDGFTFPDVLRKWRLMYAQNAYDCVVIACGINDASMIADLEDAGRHEEASAFFADSMAALHTLLYEMGSTADIQTPYKQLQSNTAPSSSASSGITRILLLEPFLFPVPQARMRWLPVLQKVREYGQKTVAAFPAAAAPRVRYIPTQTSLDSLVSELGYSAVTTDGIHLTDKGHECLAKLVADALRTI